MTKPIMHTAIVKMVTGTVTLRSPDKDFVASILMKMVGKAPKVENEVPTLSYPTMEGETVTVPIARPKRDLWYAQIISDGHHYDGVQRYIDDDLKVLVKRSNDPDYIFGQAKQFKGVDVYSWRPAHWFFSHAGNDRPAELASDDLIDVILNVGGETHIGHSANMVVWRNIKAWRYSKKNARFSHD